MEGALASPLGGRHRAGYEVFSRGFDADCDDPPGPSWAQLSLYFSLAGPSVRVASWRSSALMAVPMRVSDSVT